MWPQLTIEMAGRDVDLLTDIAAPPGARASHVGADDADNLSPIGIIPHDASHPDVCTEFDKSLPSEPVQIEPEPVLQTNSGSGAGHCCVSPLAIAWSETHVSSCK